MFKKDDVVVFTTRGGELVKEDERFVVHVLEDQEEQSHFVGQVVERGHRATHRIGVTSHYWSAKQFKLKQQNVVSDATPDNVFPVLQDGMIVTTRGRGSYLVVGEKLLDHGGYNSLHDYTEEGEVIGASDEFDIVKVYSGVSLFSLDLERYIALNSYQLVWQERKNAKAIADIEEQMVDLQEQLNTLQEKLVTLREEK